MSVIPGVAIGGPIVPTDSTDTYPVTDPQWGLGGTRYAATLTARNAIPVPRLQKGMFVFVGANNTTYRLKNSWSGSLSVDADWEIYDFLSVNRVEVGAGPYSILSSDYYLAKTAINSGGDTLTLPSAASVGNGKIYKVKDASYSAGTNNITIDTSSGDTVESEAAFIMSVNGAAIELVSDGVSNWEVN